MGRYLVPFSMTTAMLAFAVSAVTVAAVPEHPAWWRGAVMLAVLGGITPMIYAVNIRIVPVFARRAWRSQSLIRAQIVLAIGGAWLTFAGRVLGSHDTETVGQFAALAGAVLFTVNLARLFKQPAGATPALPLPYPDQAVVDKIATRFTRLAGIYLLFGLITGVAIEIHPPRSGRWDLVWAHALLVGFFLTMASGVSYHVLARWTTRRWRSVRAIRLHFWLVAFGLPLMLAGLMLDRNWLFHAAGPIQAAALLLFLWNTLPLALGLPGISRIAWPLATALLTTGVVFGAIFAGYPVSGVRLRMAHAEINLWGWSGLLIASAGYYLVPRFAGRPLFWPRLAPLQIAMLTAGVVAGATMLGFRGYGHDPGLWLIVPQAMIAISFVTFGVIVAGTFLLAKPGTAVSISPRRAVPLQRSVQRPSSGASGRRSARSSTCRGRAAIDGSTTDGSCDLPRFQAGGSLAGNDSAPAPSTSFSIASGGIARSSVAWCSLMTIPPIRSIASRSSGLGGCKRDASSGETDLDSPSFR